MKNDIHLKEPYFLVMAVVGLLLIQIKVAAFHDSSSLICNKCHTMHYSEAGAIPSKANGAPVDADAGGPFKRLIYKAAIADLCLTCHSEGDGGAPAVSNPGGALTVKKPGGNFYYSKSGNPSYGEKYGHNPGGILGTDSTLSQAPGGTFTASSETCISCHDPHGDVPDINSYRNLLYKPGNWTGADLVITAIENSLGGNESATNKPQYLGGMSSWCGGCHTGFQGSEVTDPNVGDGVHWIRHPDDRALGAEMAGHYGTAYDWQYPIQDLNFNWTVESTDQVFCLSCHRAHATEYPNSARWNNTQPSGAGTGCNKCHAKGS